MSKKGSIPWNKDKKLNERQKSKLNLSGLKFGRGWNKDKKLSEEHKKKISLSKTNPSLAIRKKLSISHLGKSPSNKGKARPEISGEKHWNWKGGLTPDYLKWRHSIEYKIWHFGIFSKDNFTCQKCKVRGGKLVAHHILNFSKYPELRFAIDNGITLCRDCHREFHRRYGIKNNTGEQVKEFLLNVKIS